MWKKLLNRRGISLIELVLVVAIIGLVLNVVYSIYFVGRNSFAVSNNRGFSQQAVRNTNLFFDNELKFINGILSEEQVNNGYMSSSFYGLKVVSDSVVIERYTHVSETTPMYDVVEVKRFKSELDDISVSHVDDNILNLNLLATETSGGLSSSYILDYNVELINYTGSRSDTNNIWDLSEEGTIMYYTKSGDTLAGKINLNEQEPYTPENPDNPNPGSPGQININSNDIIVKDKNGNVVSKSDDGVYKIVKKSSYTIIIKYVYTGSMNLVLNVDGTNTSPSDNTVTITGTAKNGNQSKTHRLSITENGDEIKVVEIIIQSI